MHIAVSGCPKAHGKPPEECRAREELNRLRLKAIPPTTMAIGSASSLSLEAGEGMFSLVPRPLLGVGSGHETRGCLMWDTARRRLGELTG